MVVSSPDLSTGLDSLCDQQYKSFLLPVAILGSSLTLGCSSLAEEQAHLSVGLESPWHHLMKTLVLHCKELQQVSITSASRRLVGSLEGSVRGLTEAHQSSAMGK